MTAAAQIDHLVVAAATLDEGVAWCEATLGVVPGPGGQHPLMGTHNRLLGLGGERFARCYFEIIAIDPAAVPARARHQRRWFDLDDPVLQAALAKDGPRLVHWWRACPMRGPPCTHSPRSRCTSTAARCWRRRATHRRAG